MRSVATNIYYLDLYLYLYINNRDARVCVRACV